MSEASMRADYVMPQSITTSFAKTSSRERYHDQKHHYFEYIYGESKDEEDWQTSEVVKNTLPTCNIMWTIIFRCCRDYYF
jgi:hypothetical protein